MQPQNNWGEKKKCNTNYGSKCLKIARNFSSNSSLSIETKTYFKKPGLVNNAICKCKITFSSRRVEATTNSWLAFERMFTAYYRCNDDYLRKKKKCDEKFHRKMFLHNLHIVSRWRNLGHASRRRGEEMIRGDLDNFLTRNWMLSWLDCCCWTTKKWGSKADCKAHPTGKIAYTIPQIRELSSFPNNF